MNIVFVFDGLQLGGIERIGVDYINLLSDRGHNIRVINISPRLKELYCQLPNDCKILEYKLPRSLVPFRYAKVIENGISGALAYAIISTVLNAINFYRKILAKWKFKGFQDTEAIIAFSGHFNDLMFVASNIIPGKKIAWLHGAEFEYKIISDGYFALYKRIKNLVCLSELCDITCKKFNEKNSINKCLIHNPVMIQNKKCDKAKVQKLKEQYGNFILMAGRLAPDKDQKTVIRAVKYINENRQKKVNLLLAGDGIMRDELENFVIEMSAEKFVHFLGSCTDMENYYSAAYVYVHSSPMEGLPTVLLEALAYKVPIASTDSIPGVREILGNNEFGLISPVGDWKQLGKNIMRLLDENDLRKRLIKCGSRRILDFAPDIAVDKLEYFIQKQ